MESTFQRSFAGGELAPSLAARADVAKYLAGLRTCRNFMVLRSGGVSNRPGTRFINESKTNSTSTFLLRYISETAGESLLLEAGQFYLRFYKNGALVRLTGVAAWSAATNYPIGAIVVQGGVNYYSITTPNLNHVPPNASFWYAMPSDILEVPTPFGNGGFRYHQSGNVLTLTSTNGIVQPHELIFQGLTSWVIRPVSTAPAIGPPTGLGSTPGPAGALSYQYVVTAAAVDTYEESIASAIHQLNSIGEPTIESPHVLNWTAPAGGPAAVEYYIYKDPYGNGTFGFIGTATGLTTFRDIGFTPDFAVTPPLPRVLFNTTNNYPRVSATYQQRRFFGNTNFNPDAVFGSRTGFISNFNISSPLQDDDAITFRIAGSQHNPVRHLVGLKQFIVLTDDGGWAVGRPLEALTPTNLPADQHTYVGAADIRPVIVGNSILYVQTRGSIVRDLRFDQEVEGLAGRDLTLFASHLFDGKTLLRMDYQQVPHSIVWVTRTDGVLLGLTYLREQEVWGWHQHTTGAAGLFEDVVVVPEIGEDAVYVLVRRTINGVFKRYIERLESREILDVATDAFFVDSGLSYSGTPITTITGLGHLEGQVISIVADGVVVFNGDPSSPILEQFRVSGGSIALSAPASVIHAGLPIQFAEIETLDLDVEGTAIRDKRKRVGVLSLLLEATCRVFWAGPDAARLRKVKLAAFESGGDIIPFTGQHEMNVGTDFNVSGRIMVRQIDPLPITILGVLPRVELGG